jgi:dTDP-4-dehydrorhamnose 3,5-epimerase
VRFVRTEIPGVVLIEPDVHKDARGYFLETYHAEKYRAAGIPDTFVQDNVSKSAGGTVRGLHLQIDHPQGKLIRVVEGEIFDVAVDVRRGSPTFGKWVGLTLSGDNFAQCYVPPGFAHGFAVVSSSAIVEYKCTDKYDPASEIGILWNDPAIGIKWPLKIAPTLSDRDRKNPTLAAAAERLPRYTEL